MTIAFTCECGKGLQARDEHAGRQTKCPACGALLAIPGTSEAILPAYPPSDLERAIERRRAAADAIGGRDMGTERSAPVPTPSRTSGKATAALILGLLSLCGFLFTGIPAIILGLLSLRDIRQSGGRLTGKGLAVLGMALAVFFPMACAGASALGYVLFGTTIDWVREAGSITQSQNNLRQMGVAMHNYHDAIGRFPLNTSVPIGMPREMQHAQSWRVAILPYVEQGGMFRQYNPNEPWDGPNNRQLLKPTPPIFVHPLATPEQTAAGLTHYRVFIGPETMFGEPGGTRITSITDGTSNTIMVVEAAEPVPWMQPEGLTLDPRGGALPPLGGLFKSGFNVLMADGSVSMVRKDFNSSMLRAAVTRSGGETLDWEQLFGR